MDKDNTSRFTHKANDYEKYRPTYPGELLKLLQTKLGLTSSSVIADIGSGTGISSKLFIQNGNKVFGVEPNPQMSEVAEMEFKNDSNFKSINGSGEQTHLDAHSIDLIFCGQAFHWFDKIRSKKEFSRILKSKGNIVLSWNIIDESSTIGSAYQQVLKKHIKGYSELQDIKIDEQEIEKFFSPKLLHKETLKNSQILDLPAFLGRIRSSSLVPNEGNIYQKVVREMETIFSDYKKDDSINLGYQTYVYWC